ncbi:uncharacterized protein LOC120629616 isoform X2 [Pararge aegeria]|nr:uncharacterized protein LOC120629616 isoform X2 [Pararge aegeria]
MILSMSYNKNMRTSSTQFEIMLNFMELNGDLTYKVQTNNPQTRIQVIQDWEELTTLLNSDPTGEKKPTEKWKKVWSDLKNNTKRKALKLKATVQNGVGAKVSSKAQLSDFEKRVLNMLSECSKAGGTSFSEENTVTQDSDRTVASLSPPQESQEHLQPAFVGLRDYPTIIKIEAPPMISKSEKWEPPRIPQTNIPKSPPMSDSSTQQESVIPAIEGQIPVYESTPKLRNHTVLRSKLFKRKNKDKLNESFIKFVIEKGRAETEIEKERLRLREMELNIQKQWQVVATKAIDALHKVIETKLN